MAKMGAGVQLAVVLAGFFSPWEMQRYGDILAGD